MTTCDCSSADGSSDVSRHTLYSGSLNFSPYGLILLIYGFFSVTFCQYVCKFDLRLKCTLVCEGVKSVWPVINWCPLWTL